MSEITKTRQVLVALIDILNEAIQKIYDLLDEIDEEGS